ncbi:Lrp/AsnC family transcriptional regulator [Aliikangiella coralliicola]|uniref:Lrp/AsnC family transcriptional regulator n=1 Tax=Aliikangiella coralliicola TaxID=2592383 RepID=UPI001AEFE19C|nr:Lrp/AsnC family transcriptional regulator [Aliikangiella coralliicola]
MSDKLDDKDRKLISLLRDNARMPVVILAKKLGVSRATVQNRINKLEQNGVVQGYTLKLKPEAESHLVRLFMNITVKAKNETAVIKDLQSFPQVVAIHHTSGHWDLMAEIRAESLPSLNTLLGEIRLIDGIEQTETNLLLDTVL